MIGEINKEYTKYKGGPPQRWMACRRWRWRHRFVPERRLKKGDKKRGGGSCNNQIGLQCMYPMYVCIGGGCGLVRGDIALYLREDKKKKG